MSHTGVTTNVPGDYVPSTAGITYCYPYTYYQLYPTAPEKPVCFKQKCGCCYWKDNCANAKKCKA